MLKIIKLIIEIYIMPKKFLKHYQESEYHIRDILNTLFLITMPLCIGIYVINNMFDVKHIIYTVIFSGLNIYILPLFDVFIIFIFNKIFVKNKMMFREILVVILPIIISDVAILVLQNFLMLTGFYNIFIIKKLYSIVIAMYGLGLMLYYLYRIHNYKYKCLLVIILIFSLFYLCGI